MTDYTTLAAVKGQLGISDTARDVDLSAVITAVSREIDQITGTVFGASGPAVPRTFYTEDPYNVWVDRFTNTTGLVVATGVRGTYNTVIASTDYVLWPQNAPSRALAYNWITVPYGFFRLENDRPTVQVTAMWGWDTIPEQVEWAARMMAARLFKRRESLEGVLAPAEWGAVRVARTDPDIQMLLAPYINAGIA